MGENQEGVKRGKGKLSKNRKIKRVLLNGKRLKGKEGKNGTKVDKELRADRRRSHICVDRYICIGR